MELKTDRPLKGRATVVVKGPGSFRIEVYGPFGQTMAVFTSDGDTLAVFSDGAVKYYPWGSPLTPYQFDPQDAVAFLTGAVTEGSAASGDRKVTMDASGHVERIVKFKEGIPVLTVKLGDYRNVAGASVPFSISIDDGKGILDIRYSSVEIDPRIDSDIFRINTVP